MILNFLKNKKKHQLPKTVFWWLEMICNLNCNHCDIGKKTLISKFRPALTIKNKKKLLQKLHNWLGDGFSLAILAGEPFLHKDMLEILSYANKKNITTSVTSNGTLISSAKKAEEIVKSGLDFLTLSLESYNSEIHDKSRGKIGTRDLVFKTIKNLQLAKKKYKSKKPIIYINSIIMKDNLEELPKIVKWVKKEKIDGITFQPIANPDMFEVDEKKGDYWFKTSSLWPEKKKVLNLLNKLKKMKKDGYPIKNSDKDFKKYEKYFNNPIEFANGPANEGELESLSITHDGYVKMCPSLHENFGNILKDNLDVMWESKQAEKARDHILGCKSQCKILANNKEDFYF